MSCTHNIPAEVGQEYVPIVIVSLLVNWHHHAVKVNVQLERTFNSCLIKYGVKIYIHFDTPVNSTVIQAEFLKSTKDLAGLLVADLKKRLERTQLVKILPELSLKIPNYTFFDY